MQVVLKLFIADHLSSSMRAIINVKRMMKECLGEQCSLEIIDVCNAPQSASENRIMATPCLTRTSPLPQLRVIGDLSDTESVLSGLAITASGGDMAHTNQEGV